MSVEMNGSEFLRYTSAEGRSESFHQEFGFALIIFNLLLLFSLLFIWLFKHFRIRLFHETGVAMIMGIIFGIISSIIVYLLLIRLLPSPFMCVWRNTCSLLCFR